jgi:uncharacterized protein
MKFNSGFLIFSLLFFTLSTLAQEIPNRPIPPRLVNDFSDFLSEHEITQLEEKLRNFNNKTSTQIVIVIIDSLQGYDIADFSFRLGQEWGVGQKEFDNGIVILVKPQRQGMSGQVFIATGYGLEGVVPDAVAKRIVEVEIIPDFKTGNYFEGLNKAVNTLISLTEGEFTAAEYANSSEGEGFAIGTVGIILLIIILSIIARLRRARHYSLGHSIPFWTAMFLAGSSGRSHTSSFSNFSSGSGSFSGFGGGSFGGGGAGGSW